MWYIVIDYSAIRVRGGIRVRHYSEMCMKLIVCVSDNMGISFNGRRQSQDREVCLDMLKLCAGKKLWMNKYSAELFEKFNDGVEIRRLLGTAEPPVIFVDDRCTERARQNEFCFYEDTIFAKTPVPSEESVDEAVLYRWNRRYPAGFFLSGILDLGHYRLEDSIDFAGKSHEKITREVWVK